MNKKRVTITLDKDLILSLDKLVDGLKIRNRSHAVEFMLRKALNQKRLKKAYILAGGKGTRLRPITYEIPKPMVPIKGRPILEHTIELLRKYDVREVIISIGYLGNKIREYFGDGSKFGVKITYIEEDEEMGTAGALRLAKPLLDEPFLMFNGDNLVNIDIDSFYEFHRDGGGLATIALTTVDNPTSYGVAVLKGSRIKAFIEKPKTPPSKLINAGVYVLEPEVIDLVPKGYSMIELEVFPKILEKNKLLGYPFEGQWFPTDNTERYEKAIKEWRGIT